MSLKQRGEHQPDRVRPYPRECALSPTISAMQIGEHAIHVQLVGDFDLASASELRRALDAALETAQHVVVAADSMTFLDCCCLGALNGARVRAAETGRCLTLVAPAPCVTRLLALTRLDEHFTVHSDLTSALGSPHLSA